MKKFQIHYFFKILLMIFSLNIYADPIHADKEIIKDIINATIVELKKSDGFTDIHITDKNGIITVTGQDDIITLLGENDTITLTGSVINQREFQDAEFAVKEAIKTVEKAKGINLQIEINNLLHIDN